MLIRHPALWWPAVPVIGFAHLGAVARVRLALRRGVVGYGAASSRGS